MASLNCHGLLPT